VCDTRCCNCNSVRCVKQLSTPRTRRAFHSSIRECRAKTRRNKCAPESEYRLRVKLAMPPGRCRSVSVVIDCSSTLSVPWCRSRGPGLPCTDHWRPATGQAAAAAAAAVWLDVDGGVGGRASVAEHRHRHRRAARPRADRRLPWPAHLRRAGRRVFTSKISR